MENINEPTNNTLKFGVLNILNDYYYSLGLVSEKEYTAMRNELYKKNQKQNINKIS